MSLQPPQSVKPRNVGSLLDDTFRSFRVHGQFILTAMLCIYLPFFIIQAFFTTNLSSTLSELQNLSNPQDVWPQLQSHIPSLIGTSILSLVSALIISPLLFGTLLQRVVRYTRDGETVMFRDAFSFSLGRLLPVLGTGLLKWIILGAIYFVGIIIVGIVTAGFSALHVPIVIIVILAIIIIPALVCLLVWLMIQWSFSSCAAIMERKAGWRGLKRSFALVRGNFWRVLGYLLLVQLIVGAVSFGLNMMFMMIPSLGVRAVCNQIITLVTVPFGLLAIAQMYIDLCVRTDATDLQDWLNS